MVHPVRISFSEDNVLWLRYYAPHGIYICDVRALWPKAGTLLPEHIYLSHDGFFRACKVPKYGVNLPLNG